MSSIGLDPVAAGARRPRSRPDPGSRRAPLPPRRWRRARLQRRDRLPQGSSGAQRVVDHHHRAGLGSSAPSDLAAGEVGLALLADRQTRCTGPRPAPHMPTPAASPSSRARRSGSPRRCRQPVQQAAGGQPQAVGGGRHAPAVEHPRRRCSRCGAAPGCAGVDAEDALVDPLYVCLAAAQPGGCVVADEPTPGGARALADPSPPGRRRATLCVDWPSARRSARRPAPRAPRAAHGRPVRRTAARTGRSPRGRPPGQSQSAATALAALREAPPAGRHGTPPPSIRWPPVAGRGRCRGDLHDPPSCCSRARTARISLRTAAEPVVRPDRQLLRELASPASEPAAAAFAALGKFVRFACHGTLHSRPCLAAPPHRSGRTQRCSTWILSPADTRSDMRRNDGSGSPNGGSAPAERALSPPRRQTRFTGRHAVEEDP